jgi:hypothetical protein
MLLGYLSFLDEMSLVEFSSSLPQQHGAPPSDASALQRLCKAKPQKNKRSTKLNLKKKELQS